MNNYKVLWFDDKHKEYEIEKDEASHKGIELICFENAEDGLQDLKVNYTSYDAIIIDGLFYKNSTQKGDADNKAFGEVASTIDNLHSQGIIIPWFIYSGQKYIVKDKDDLISFFAGKAFCNGRIFDKSEDDDFIELCDEIIKAANQIETTKLKHKYPNIFTICEDNYLGSKQFDRILQLVKDIGSPENIANQQEALSPMRKILEALFKKLNEIGLIPNEVQEGKGAINGASIFLAGNNNNYNYTEELIHPVIAESIRHLISLTQDASHNEGNKLRADTYLSESPNTFVYQSLCFALFEVLDYIKGYLDVNSDRNSNLKKWNLKEIELSSEDIILGEIIRIAENDWGTFQSEILSDTIGVHPNLMKLHNLKEGAKIKITTKPSPCNTKLYIKEILK